MSKIRINDLARELEVKSKEILDVLTTVGVTEKKTHSSSLEDHEADLVRKHLRGRFDAAPSSAKPSSRAAHGEEEIKTKIDLSHISRPGDVLRAITQQKGATEHPSPRPAVKAAGCDACGRSKAEAPAALATPKAVPPRPASEAPAPPAPRMVTPGFGSRHVPPADGGRDSAQSSCNSAGRDHGRLPPASTAPPAIAVPPRPRSSCRRPAGSAPSSAAQPPVRE
jgi:translation initiation factor IF-2